jgi:hypothetical protein
VVEYAWPKPDQVYRVVSFRDRDAPSYGIREEGQTRIVYYRDVPDRLKEPVTVRKKVASTKELQVLRQLLDTSVRNGSD